MFNDGKKEMNLKDFAKKLKCLNSVKKLRKKKIELNEERIKIIAAGAVVGFLLSKMRF